MEPGKKRTPNGFSLLEVLVALTILGIALLLGMALVLQNPRIVRRADDERQAFRALESTLEAVRAGVLPLQDLEIAGFATAVGTPAPEDLAIEMQVEPTTTPGLYEVTLSARYSFARRRVVKRLRTMVWSPPTES